MRKLIKPSTLQDKIIAPGSKSMMQRAVAAAILTQGTTKLFQPSFCDDCIAALDIAKKLGANVSKEDNHFEITGTSKLMNPVLNCGEAGLGIRMFTPIAALFEQEIELTGRGSLLKRPVDMLEGPLQQLGVKCTTQKGLLPIHVQGPMKGGNLSLDGSISSQMLTGFLIALPAAPNDSMISVSNLKSKPYIDMTQDALSKFGIQFINNDYKEFIIKGAQEYKACDFNVEGDWSGGAFLLVAGAIAGDISVENLNSDSYQADKDILLALERAGAQMTIEGDTIHIIKADKLKAFEFDATDCPDLFPPLACLAAHCQGTTKIQGVSRLKHKESDRATVLQNEFSNIGIDIKIDGDYMFITGGEPQSGTFHSHNDHRIAMAGTVVALKGDALITVEEAECVAKSYPEFFEDIERLGAVIENE